MCVLNAKKTTLPLTVSFLDQESFANNRTDEDRYSGYERDTQPGGQTLPDGHGGHAGGDGSHKVRP